MQLAILLLLSLYATQCLAHSWIHCTDYQIGSQRDREYWNVGRCRGYPRGFTRNGHSSQRFGRNYFHNDLRNGNKPCFYPLALPYSNGYTNDFPMATYTAGQEVCIAWSAQNHVAASCANPFIPDNGNKIYVSGANPTQDQHVNQRREIADFGRNTARDQYRGFQNCPRFCENNVEALCTGCFRVPTNLQAGQIYTFTWEWIFNNRAETYTTCWEARVNGGGGGNPPSNPNPPPNPRPNPPSNPRPNPPSGGGGCRGVSVAHDPTNEWWVEVNAPEGRRVQVECNGERNNLITCEPKFGKYQCAPSRPCRPDSQTARYAYVNGERCRLSGEAQAVGDADTDSTSASSKGLPVFAYVLVGIGAALVVVIVVLVVMVSRRSRGQEQV